MSSELDPITMQARACVRYMMHINLRREEENVRLILTTPFIRTYMDCLYGPTGTQSFETLLTLLDALQLVGHSQAEELALWVQKEKIGEPPSDPFEESDLWPKRISAIMAEYGCEYVQMDWIGWHSIRTSFRKKTGDYRTITVSRKNRDNGQELLENLREEMANHV